MRNISDYENEYLKPDFEKYQVIQRRKKVLDSIYGRKKILEIGCGIDPMFKYIDWEVDVYKVFEPGGKFIDNAKKVARDIGKEILFINKPFTAEDDTDGLEYDAVICSGLLHEVENPAELLENICMVSNKETLIHINVPNANSFHRLLAKEMKLISDTKQFSERNVKLQQNTVFDMDSLKSLCGEAGLVVESCGSYFVKPFAHFQMKQMMDEGIIDERVLDGLYSMTKYMPELGSEIYVNCRKQ